MTAGTDPIRNKLTKRYAPMSIPNRAYGLWMFLYGELCRDNDDVKELDEIRSIYDKVTKIVEDYGWH